LTNGATLAGFTITGGATRNAGDVASEQSGGGVWCESPEIIVSDCLITSNAAYNGGGAYYGVLTNCNLYGNSAQNGGGAHSCALGNCTLSGNTAASAGGGACQSTMSGCTLIENFARVNGGGASEGALNQCLLMRNSTAGSGGGVYWLTITNSLLDGNVALNGGGGGYSSLSNCRLMGNSSSNRGGADYYGTLNNCLLVGNAATNRGGGTYRGTLNNCTVMSNMTYGIGGGAYQGFMNNCVVFYNNASNSANYYGSTMNYTCAAPLLTNGNGNISLEPMFVDRTNGNLRLQSNSPCINSGEKSLVTTATDLDGNPRIVNGIVDMGAFEYQGVHQGSFVAWLQQHGLATDGSADFMDSDADGLNNWQEWRCRSNPTNAQSLLRLEAVLLPELRGEVIRWQSASGVRYVLEESTNLPAFTPLPPGILGPDGYLSFTNQASGDVRQRFYRIRIAD
jgi:hypothetical protein